MEYPALWGMRVQAESHPGKRWYWLTPPTGWYWLTPAWLIFYSINHLMTPPPPSQLHHCPDAMLTFRAICWKKSLQIRKSWAVSRNNGTVIFLQAVVPTVVREMLQLAGSTFCCVRRYTFRMLSGICCLLYLMSNAQAGHTVFKEHPHMISYYSSVFSLSSILMARMQNYFYDNSIEIILPSSALTVISAGSSVFCFSLDKVT